MSQTKTNPSPDGEMTVGRQIFLLRTRQGMTQETLGELLHVTRQTVSNWENGVSQT